MQALRAWVGSRRIDSKKVKANRYTGVIRKLRVLRWYFNAVQWSCMLLRMSPFPSFVHMAIIAEIQQSYVLL